MSRTLDVYLHNHLVGRLIQDDGGQMVFDYLDTWLKNPKAIPLSQSLPLREKRFSRKECQGFFAGILPEESKRETIARNLGISSKNDYAMLEKIGGECAGAVTFIPEGEPLPEKNYRYRELNDRELATILRELPRRPLMAGNKDVRLSLAGVQDKIAVHVSSETIFLPLGGAPSTHILKPAIDRFEGVVFNEALCMQLANKIGIPAAIVESRHVEDIAYLLVERYDRKILPSSQKPEGGYVWTNFVTRRVHQEDFCQALAVSPDLKYQSEGGPSLKQCFGLLRAISSVPAIDLLHMLDGVIFNILIGNHDAHSKNFSLLYDETTFDEGKVLDQGKPLDSHARLAPFYDLICTVYYPELGPRMAMKLGGEYGSENLFPKHFEKFAEETGLAKIMVVRRVQELAETVREVISDVEINHEVARKVVALIKKRCETFMERFKK